MVTTTGALFSRLTLVLFIFLVISCDNNTRSDSQALYGELATSAPSGIYENDPTHSTLQFSISHLGLSNYIARFSDYSVDMTLNSDEISASRVSVEINPKLIQTDYRGDYKGTHPESDFESWEQDLAYSDKFFNANIYPRIFFESTHVRLTPSGTLKITGDLTLLDQTNSVFLEGKIIGSTANHPFTERGAIGFSVSGTFKRSAFGMDFLLEPPLLGDEVTMTYEGEMLEVPAAYNLGIKTSEN